ncbi:MAG: hypothetical protein ACR652_22960 [Methylocystis sp.]|uniref:hypothetical protein n=1 Tax=Methylocystis sp. TaxID=1911079 RepID=UPI003DA40012
MRDGFCTVFDLSRRGAGLVVALSAILALGAPAEAGFLEDLFGIDDGVQHAPPPPRARAPRNSGRGDYSIRVLEGRKASGGAQKNADGDRRDYVAGSRPQKPRLCATPEQAATAAPSSAYLRDETLRAGDSVVTDGDIVVFKGRSACPHTAADFVSVARSDLPKAKRNALVALEQAMKSPAPVFTVGAHARPRLVGQVTETRPIE